MATVAEIDAFGALVQTMLAHHHARSKNVGDPPKITIEYGTKYARIVETDGSSRSSYGFIDRETGNILKAASWRRLQRSTPEEISPATIRCRAVCGPYGIAYLR